LILKHYSGFTSGSSLGNSSFGDWLCSEISVRGLFSEDNFSSDSLLSFSSFVSSEGGSRCYYSLDNGLGIWLHPKVVLVEGLLTKCPLLSLPGSEMIAAVLGNSLGL
jgi:hypothetical protein